MTFVKKIAIEIYEESDKENALEQEMVPYLLHWFDYNARILPWREEPKPYYVWISEIMLQQTRVEAVKSYFERFIRELPDIQALAEVPEERLLKLWEGLGYYSRARNLKKAAGIVMQEYAGRLPDTKEELLKLPGIGPYTAGAIASIAYGRVAAAVDGNVLRVMMRLRGSFEDITKESVKRELGKALEKVMPEECPGAFTQAMMELGATVCLPNGKPLCEQCPVMHLCKAFQQGTELQIPVKPEKKARRIEKKTIFVLETPAGLLLHKRQAKGLLAGLWEFPNYSGRLGSEAAEELLGNMGYSVQELSSMGEAKHIFSHIEWHMTGYYAKVEEVQRLVKDARNLYSAKETEQSTAEFAKALKESIAVNRQILAQEYSIPAAFAAYRATTKPEEEL